MCNIYIFLIWYILHMSFLKPSELTKIPEYTDWSNEKEIELSNNKCLQI